MRLRFSLVLLVIMAAINVGCYVWINNSVAVMPDNDPSTVVLLELYDDFDHGSGDPSNDVYTSPRQSDEADSKAQMVFHGNGAQDDNRVVPFAFRPAVSATALGDWMSAVTSFAERRTVKTYWDFGHLRVMPTKTLALGNEKAVRLCSDGFFIAAFAARKVVVLNSQTNDRLVCALNF